MANGIFSRIRKVLKRGKPVFIISMVIVLIAALTGVFLLIKPLFPQLNDQEMIEQSQKDKAYFNDNKERLERIAVYLEDNYDQFATKPAYFSLMTTDVDLVPDLAMRQDISDLLQQGDVKNIILGTDRDDGVRFVMQQYRYFEKAENEYLQEFCHVKNTAEIAYGHKIIQNKHHLIRRYEKLAENWCAYIYALKDAADYRAAAWNCLDPHDQKIMITVWSEAAVTLTEMPDGLKRDTKDRELAVCVMFHWRFGGEVNPYQVYLDPDTLEFIGIPAYL